MLIEMRLMLLVSFALSALATVAREHWSRLCVASAISGILTLLRQKSCRSAVMRSGTTGAGASEPETKSLVRRSASTKQLSGSAGSTIFRSS